ncbi:MAG: hypothetical protein WBP79_11550 [Candidatus Acidiferrales bacterium]
MACEKYSGRITDAALGELPSERMPDLLAHVAECDACREAYRSAKGVAAFVDRGMESLVVGEPSPQFTARLRSRIAAETAPTTAHWIAWAPVAAGALALACLLTLMVLRSPHRGNPNFAGVVITSNRPNTPPAQARSKAAAPPRHANSHPVFSADLHPPEVLVPPGQFSAAIRFDEALESGHISGDQLLASHEEMQKPVEVRAIEIAPLETPGETEPTGSSENSTRF